MSAIAALKGYRTQFLYSLFYILSHPAEKYRFKLEGVEDLDILNEDGQLLFAIQIKNLSKPVTLSDIITKDKTSFLRRFVTEYPLSKPILVSFGSISKELKNLNSEPKVFNHVDRGIVKKYGLNEEQWKLIKTKIIFEEVKEDEIIEGILKILKDRYSVIDPVPTAENILYWLQVIAEKQLSLMSIDLFYQIERFDEYLTQRIAITEQYGTALKPLHRSLIDGIDADSLKEEFYYGTTARYEHILFNLDVNREVFLEDISKLYKKNRTIIIKGASGQGKSTLAYRYVHNNMPEALVYELRIQQDVIHTQKAIHAITAIAKNLNTPVILLINVIPNTVEWLKVVREFANQKHINFLITIRNEDWFKATAIGIDFPNEEIDLSLTKEEATIIYSRLDKQRKILHYLDFEEAWIKLGNDIPMLEFVYSITHGSSLRNKLRQQVLQISSEDYASNNQKQSDFLRMVALADSFGARIDISKLAGIGNLQFTIEKFEKEYLIKHTNDKRCVTGLHLVRSQMLTEILFDELVTLKKDYVLRCFSAISEEDLYAFLMQALYQNILLPTEVIDHFEKALSISWTAYNNILKSLLWSGIRDYIEENRKILDECFNTYGDTWIIMIDLSHGSTFNIKDFLDSLSLEDHFKETSSNLNKRLSDKNRAYKHVIQLLNNIPVPVHVPLNLFEWDAFGQLIFWLKYIPNKAKAVIEIPESVMSSAFDTLDLEKLSKLMLGMSSYSPYYDDLRGKLSGRFIERLQYAFNIVHIEITEEIRAHIIIDALVNEDSNSAKESNNDYVGGIIDLLRDAFPDKHKYSTQGYGHQLQVISPVYDETQKGISIANLPLNELVSLNATSTRLFEFSKRPKDWHEYHDLLNNWEIKINDLLQAFIVAFEAFTKNSNDYKPLIPILDNAQYSNLFKVKEPKSISDPLGIYFERKVAAQEQAKHESTILLKTKYGNFLKSQRDFQWALENFIQQSGKTLIARMQKFVDTESEPDNRFEHLSQTNLYDAIQKHKIYVKEKLLVFKSFESFNQSGISFNNLLTVAVLWKGFLKNNLLKKSLANYNYSWVLQLKKDFETRIVQECKAASKSPYFKVRYVNNDTINNKPLLIIETPNPLMGMLGFKESYNAIKKAVGFPEYSSLKYLMLQTWFSHFYIVQLIEGNTLNNQWNELPIYVFRDKEVNELELHNIVPKDINKEIVNTLSLKSWHNIFPKTEELQKLSAQFVTVRMLTEHLFDLRELEKIKLSDAGVILFEDHVLNAGQKLQTSFQYVLDSVADIMAWFPFDAQKFDNDEVEQEYWKSLIEVQESIFPTDKGDEEDYQMKLDINSLGEWIERLKYCTESWSGFILLAYGKYIDLYKEMKTS